MGSCQDFLLGAFFGYLLEWSGTIWLPIIAHFVNNTFSVIVSYFINAKVINDSIENVGSDNSTIYFAILSLFFTILLVVVLYKNEKRLIKIAWKIRHRKIQF